MLDPQKVDLLDPKSGLFEPHPLNPPTKNPFLAHFVAESGPFGRFGGGASHPPHPPGYGPEGRLHEMLGNRFIQEVQFLDAEGKTGGPGENLRKQVWTGNQMHIWPRDWESNPGPLVHSAREEPLAHATCGLTP